MLFKYYTADGRMIHFSVKNEEAQAFKQRFAWEFLSHLSDHEEESYDESHPKLTLANFELRFKTQEDFDDFTVRHLDDFELLDNNLQPYVGCLHVTCFNDRITYITKGKDEYSTDSKGQSVDGYGRFNDQILFKDLKEIMPASELAKAEALFNFLATKKNYYGFPYELLRPLKPYLFQIAINRGHLYKIEVNTGSSSASPAFFQEKEARFNRIEGNDLLLSKTKKIIKDILQHPLLISLLFFEGIKTNDPYKIFARKEGNYFIAMAGALYHTLHHLNEKISIELINNLHLYCIQGVRGLNSNVEKGMHTSSVYYRYRYDHIADKQLIVKAMQEMEQNKYSGLSFNAFSPYENEKSIAVDRKERMGYSVNFFIKKDKNYIKFSPAAGGECDYQAIAKGVNLEAIFIKSSNLTTDDDLKKTINAVLLDYETDVKEAEKNEDKIRLAIVKMVQNIERIHPFTDANGRTLDMLLLNRELIRHGQNPTLMDDPNNIDYLDTKTIAMFVKIGQQRYEDLVSGKELEPYYNRETADKVCIAKEWKDSFERMRDELFIVDLYSQEQGLSHQEASIEIENTVACQR